jgi:hypothetical protein
MALATFASLAIATELLTKRDVPATPERARDWMAIVRHFLRAPSTQLSWEDAVLRTVVALQPVPSPAEVPDQPPRGLVGREGRPRADIRRRLEQRYEALEAVAEGREFVSPGSPIKF